MTVTCAPVPLREIGHLELITDRASSTGRQAVETVRRWIAGLFRHADPRVGDAVYTIKFIAVEFLTNAIRHSRSGEPGGITKLRLLADGIGFIRVEVTDKGSDNGMPRIREELFAVTNGEVAYLGDLNPDATEAAFAQTGIGGGLRAVREFSVDFDVDVPKDRTYCTVSATVSIL